MFSRLEYHLNWPITLERRNIHFYHVLKQLGLRKHVNVAIISTAARKWAMGLLAKFISLAVAATCLIVVVVVVVETQCYTRVTNSHTWRSRGRDDWRRKNADSWDKGTQMCDGVRD